MRFQSEINCETFAPVHASGSYTQFADLYGNEVTVRHSSLATLSAAWIFTQGVNGNRGAAHLCTAMAREVIAALTRFVEASEDCGNEGHAQPAQIAAAGLTPPPEGAGMRPPVLSARGTGKPAGAIARAEDVQHAREGSEADGT